MNPLLAVTALSATSERVVPLKAGFDQFFLNRPDFHHLGCNSAPPSHLKWERLAEIENGVERLLFGGGHIGVDRLTSAKADDATPALGDRMTVC
ncbi:hypothetical protein [Paraburkholderia ginsengisoli]|uniref:Uncharacterized protein n=1 Tax=Paraburkholderia ginsengisoli TaxID=311231 RepID=A0A7T4N9Y9_9BURK|nr:hypothetical protein [Paraburkholderia ginsengisoli]QQC67959.1 hypothetical protein I6I06_28695 [Paraburkholderia ginsengisoli]